MLSPIAWRTPPRHYGPWEQFASLLTEGLVAAGHHVTLFATADSITASLRATARCDWSEDVTIAYVSISDADRHPDLQYAATIHHGIEIDEFRVHQSPGEHLLFFGQIHPDKGTAHAIEVARRCGRRLDIAGIIQDERYFDDEVAPHVDGNRVRYLGPVDASARAGVLGGAHALLHLIDFDEPFGYSLVEAMACGMVYRDVIGSLK